VDSIGDDNDAGDLLQLLRYEPLLFIIQHGALSRDNDGWFVGADT